MTRNHLFNILQYVFPLTEDTRQNLLNSVRSSKVIFTAMYFTPGLHPPRLAFASHSGYCLCHSLYYIAYKISQNHFCVKEYFVSFWFYYIYNVIGDEKIYLDNLSFLLKTALKLYFAQFRPQYLVTFSKIDKIFLQMQKNTCKMTGQRL